MIQLILKYCNRNRAWSTHLALPVRDNGIGIDAPPHEKVFGLFDKVDPRTQDTGIGAALVKRMIVVHGGRICVESDGIGHGSTFCLTWPLGDLQG